MSDLKIKCTRCRHSCMKSELLDIPSKRYGFTQSTCPRCGCKSYYDMTPQVAWCWASGLIEIGDEAPQNNPDGSGVIVIATGPKYALHGHVSAMARHGRGASASQLIVPGVPEAADSSAALDALNDWLRLCSKGRRRDGVTFVPERSPQW